MQLSTPDAMLRACSLLLFCTLGGAAPVPWAVPAGPELDGDLAVFEAFYYRYGERPPEASIRRVLDAARDPAAKPNILIMASVAAREGWTTERVDVADLLARAAESGDPAGVAARGAELCAGKVVKADPKGGLALLRRASEAGDAAVDFYLGRSYAASLPGVLKRDLDEAERLLRRGLERGMIRCLNPLFKIAAMRGDRGRYVSALTDAGTAGDPEAMVLLFRWYHDDPAARDPEKATRWAQRGAMLGVPSLMKAYAIALEEGVGTPRDSFLAFRFAQRASLLGDRDATVMLEQAKVSGHLATRPNPAEGLKRLAELAETWPEAQFAYGQMLVAGELIDRDEPRGRALIERAAEAGYTPAKQWIETENAKREKGPRQELGL